MLAENVIVDWLTALGFTRVAEGRYSKALPGGQVVLADLGLDELHYPSEIRIISRTTCNFDHLENLVVLDCVLRLIANGYPLSALTLEPTWRVGHGNSGGRGDILVRDTLGLPYVLIECKTWGAEFEKEWRKTRDGQGQLFSYAQQETSVQFLALYASDVTSAGVRQDLRLISHIDDESVLTNSEARAYRRAHTADERYVAWRDTYQSSYLRHGLFDGNNIPYRIGKFPLTSAELDTLDEADRRAKSGEFATILRKHNISGRENAFDVLVNLFLAKLVDESDNPNDLQFAWRGAQVETAYDLVERLELLYRKGMKDYLDEEVSFVGSSDITAAMRFIEATPDAAKARIAELFRYQKFFTRSNFGLLDVHNETLFHKNAAVLIELVDMWQKSRLSVAPSDPNSSQALGDMFEIFLDAGIKQNEGQYFTPIPVCDFMIDCLPQSSGGTPERVIDYACGAGHFLTQYFTKRIAPLSDPADIYAASRMLFGVEKEYRLSKVARVSLAMHGVAAGTIRYQDALAKMTSPLPVRDGEFDVLIANPPYSVAGFLTQMAAVDEQSYAAAKEVSNPATFDQIENLFVERASELLASGGVAAIILPESFYDREDKISARARRLLFGTFHLRALVKLPTGTFSSTGISTWIAFLKRRESGPSQYEHISARVEALFGGAEPPQGQSAYLDRHMLNRYLDAFQIADADFSAMLAQAGTRSGRDNLEREKGRMRDWWLADSNGACLLVSPVATGAAAYSKYLGYKWSKRKMHGGIHHLSANEREGAAPILDSAGNTSLTQGIASLLSSGTLQEATIASIRRDLGAVAKVDVREGYDLLSWSSDGEVPMLAVDLMPVQDISADSVYPVERVATCLSIEYGGALPRRERIAGEVPIFGSNGPVGTHNAARFSDPGVVVGRKGSAGAASLAPAASYPIDTTYFVRPKDSSKFLVEFLYLLIDHYKFPSGGSGVPSLPIGKFRRYWLPIVPIDVQRQIVDEIFAHEGCDVTSPFSIHEMKNATYRDSVLKRALGW